jgi:hypothetical protein
LKLSLEINLVIFNLLLYLLLFGVVGDAYQKKIVLIIGKNFLIGGNQNGKQLPNFHLKELFLITMSTVQRILKVEYNPVNLPNGPKHSNPLILIQAEEM